MKLSWSTKVNLDTDKLFDLNLKSSHVQQTRSRRGVYQQVQIAAVLIVAMQDGAEDARIRYARLEHKLADRLPMLRQYLRRSHGGVSSFLSSKIGRAHV